MAERVASEREMYPEYPQYSAPVYPPPPRPVVRRRAPLALRLATSLLTLLLTLAIGLTALGLALDPQLVVRVLPIVSTRVSGTIYGQNLAQISAGNAAPTPLAGATIVCGETQTSADAHGHYTLALPRGRAQRCAISAPLYAPVDVSISPRLGDGAYRLDLGPAAAHSATTGAAQAAGASATQTQAATGCALTLASEVCAALTLRPGALSGQVTASHNSLPIAHAPVFCWDDTLVARTSANPPTRYTTTADAQGHYTLANTPPGPYLCVANQQGAPQQVMVTPLTTTTFNFVECAARCSGVGYHAGPVMHTFAAYVIFWAPPGVNFEPGGQNARFQSLVRQYFTDVGDTSFFGLLTQYWDQQGPVRNVATLGGTYLDQQPYPHAGTRSDPLSDDDISAEVNRVRKQEGWKVTEGAAFIVLTGYNVQECAAFSNGRSCTFPDSAGNAFCAYHTYMPYSSGDGSSPDYMPYIYISDNYECAYLPTFTNNAIPYGDLYADGAIDSLSHEQFETVTDPEARGWFDDDPSGGEIADKCETTFGDARADGSTVVLNGHGYVVQEEYSNRSGGCAYQ